MLVLLISSGIRNANSIVTGIANHIINVNDIADGNIKNDNNSVSNHVVADYVNHVVWKKY